MPQCLLEQQEEDKEEDNVSLLYWEGKKHVEPLLLPGCPPDGPLGKEPSLPPEELEKRVFEWV